MKVDASTLPRLSVAASAIALAQAQSIAEINGPNFVSPYNGESVNVTGLVTARGDDGFWVRSLEPDDDARTSESLNIYGSNLGNFTTGDIVSFSGTVQEYRSDSDYSYLLEITDLSGLQILSSGNSVVPLVIGKDNASPPTESFSSLDVGGVLGVPNDVQKVSEVNPTLQPEKYGMDYWQALLGELVTIKSPRAIAKPNQYGDTWVVGGENWAVTGDNSRGGLTMTDGDSNPEAIIIGSPLDGTSNPDDGKLGDTLQDITGVVYQAFGFYRILPLTALKVVANQEPALPAPTPYQASNGSCMAATVGQYNIENFWPGSDGLEGRADHIVDYMGSPDLIFLQEIQDNDGATDSGTVSAEDSLNAIIDAVAERTGWRYAYIDLPPQDGMDGGEPGGNIRSCYLYNPSVLALTTEATAGSATDAVEVVDGPALTFNPGRIAPSNSAWDDSRKPLVAHWTFASSQNTTTTAPCTESTFFTINLHLGSKGGSSTLHGDPRPPINNGVDKRGEQAQLVAEFVSEILTLDPEAGVIVAGDFNEFAFVEPVENFANVSGLVNLDEAAGVAPEDRYTYIYDSNCQQLDHMYVSPKIAGRDPGYQHVHVNTWVSYDDAVSDHDPSVAVLDLS